MEEDVRVPVYLITGFLESGKTKFINNTVRQEYFQIPQTTLILNTEEGGEEYDDAVMILGNQDGGVMKGTGANKMNEVKPHTNWAKKMVMRARAFGVIKNEGAYVKLFAVKEG